MNKKDMIKHILSLWIVALIGIEFPELWERTIWIMSWFILLTILIYNE